MMLALTFTCRVLLVFLLSEPVHTNRPAPFLITENMWPRGCVLDCQRGRHRAVCASNGRLYKSLCSFQRAQCINTQLRPVPRAHCADSGQSKCQLARSQALEASSTHSTSSHVNPAVAAFVPECSADGHFLEVQCHNQTGYCWCSTPDGKPVSGTSVFHLTPNCTDHMTEMPQVTTDLESASHRGGMDGLRPTLDPSRPAAELTAPPFWVTILMNSDSKGNRSVKRPTDIPQTCERERAALLSEVRSIWQDERFIPECTADGRYNPVQCHVATGYCWCVRVDTGRPLPGTSARNRLPDCSKAGETHTDRVHRDRPLPGCPGARKKEFLESLVRALQLEAEQAGKLSPYRFLNTPPSNSSAPPPASPSSSNHSSSLPDSLPSPLPLPTSTVSVWENARPEVALRWHFTQLDVDSSGVLNEREARPFRQYLRRRLKPRRCAKKFAQYCDRDRDRGLTMEELRVCLGL